MTKFGYSRAQAHSILGTAPVQGHISRVVDIPNACATLWLPTQIAAQLYPISIMLQRHDILHQSDVDDAAYGYLDELSTPDAENVGDLDDLRQHVAWCCGESGP